MTTWISRSSLAFLALGALTACMPGQGQELLGGLSLAPAPKGFALVQTEMASGALTLVPPQGYCIDRRGLTPDFGLIARCDVLGAEGAVAAKPIGIFTVSITDLPKAAPLPSPEEKAAALNLTEVRGAEASDGLILFRANGAPPAPGLSGQHWRAIARVGTHALAVAFYGSAQDPAASGEGRDLVAELVSRTKAETP